MKNIPKVIYLNLGEMRTDEFKEFDFKNLAEVTWSQDKIDKHDIKYVLSKRAYKTHKQREGV